MLASKRLKGVFDGLARGRLERERCVFSPMIDDCDRIQPPYLIIVNENHHDGLGGHFLHRVEVSQRIHGDHRTVSSLTGAVPSRSQAVAHVRELIQSVRSPRAHEFVLVILQRDVRAGAFLPREVVGRFLVLAEERWRRAGRDGPQGLAQVSFFGQLVRPRIGDDAFWSGIRGEVRAPGDVIGRCRHSESVARGKRVLVLAG